MIGHRSKIVNDSALVKGQRSKRANFLKSLLPVSHIPLTQLPATQPPVLNLGWLFDISEYREDAGNRCHSSLYRRHACEVESSSNSQGCQPLIQPESTGMQAFRNAASCASVAVKTYEALVASVAGAKRWWLYGRQVGVGSAQAPGIILVYDEGNDNVADGRKAVRDVLTIGWASA